MDQHIQELTREDVEARMDRLAERLGLPREEALRRIDRGDFGDRIEASELHMLRFLLEEEPEYHQAAE